MRLEDLRRAAGLGTCIREGEGRLADEIKYDFGLVA